MVQHDDRELVEQALAQIREEGYAVLPAQYDADTQEGWREVHARLETANAGAEGTGSWWFGNMMERAPEEMLPAVANPNVLSILEGMMGPFIQLDNLTLAAFPPVDDPAKATQLGWHRDRWAGVPRSDSFQRPLAANAISYLQDLDDRSGPLRVIPGSHRKPIVLTDAQQSVPHPDERVIYVKAGDVVVTHNGLIHSGTPNRSDKPRYFFSIYYNLSWLHTTDDHTGRNVARIVAGARDRNDHRIMRLFGVDEQLERRANSGFLCSDEDRWAQWLAEDAAALTA